MQPLSRGPETPGKSPAARKSPDIGIACDFLLEGGAEMVIDALCDAYPGSTLYTAIHTPESLPQYPAINQAKETGRIRSGLSQAVLSLPFVPDVLGVYHFYWLYFLTSAFQHTRAHDAVIYSCAAQSKLIRTPRNTPVIVYFHTPTRWLYPGLTTREDLAAIPWSLRGLMRGLNLVLRPLDRLGIRRLRRRHAVWLCNSGYIRDRVRDIYGIECRVLHPPVDVARFRRVARRPENFFLYHGRLTFQKRVDVAIRGCLAARRALVISGQATSPALQKHLQSIVDEAVALDPQLDGLVTFLGRTTDEQLRDLLARCAAMIFPPREDFGIAPIEAIASGVPVIAFKAGGALDYLRDGVNGRFFDAQTPDSLCRVLVEFDPGHFDTETIVNSVPDLSVARFQRDFQTIVRAHIAANSR